MKIARVCPYYYTKKENAKIGLMIYFPNIVKKLKELGIEEDIFTLDSDESKNVFITKKRRLFRNTLFGFDVYKKIKNLKREYVVIQTHQANSFLLYVYKKKLGAKIIHMLHGSPLAFKKIPLANLTTLKDVTYFYLANKFICKKADAIITVSSEAKDEVINHFKVNPKKVYFVPTGVDTTLFKEKKLKKDIDLLYVGRFAVKKNVTTLIEVINILKQKLPNIKVVLIGGEKQDHKYKEVIKRIKQLKIIENITIFPLISPEKVVEFYNRAKLFVLLSYEEGMPKVVIEAMACGLPVIASNNSGMKDIIIHGENGFLVDPNNQKDIAKKIMSTLEGRKKLKVNTKKIRQKFSWETVAKETKKVYNKVLEESK